MPPLSLPALPSGKPTAWEQAIYAFLVEKRSRSGSTRTVESYARMLIAATAYRRMMKNSEPTWNTATSATASHRPGWVERMAADQQAQQSDGRCDGNDGPSRLAGPGSAPAAPSRTATRAVVALIPRAETTSLAATWIFGHAPASSASSMIRGWSGIVFLTRVA